MIVLRLASGERYVFPPFVQMQKDLLAMQTNAGLSNVSTLLPGLSAIAKIGGVAEVTRLKFLNRVLAARLVAAQAAQQVKVADLTSAQGYLTASEANLTPINRFLAANQGAVGAIEQSAAGKQALDTLRDIDESDRAIVDRETYLDSRERFWVAEIQLAQKWIAARIAYLNSQFGVVA